MPGKDGRSGQVGSLLLGRWDGDDLRYAGRVGSGFDATDLAAFARLLAARRRDTSPFTAGTPPRGAQWVEPDLVVSVRFRTWTDAGIVRQSSYVGLRDDIPPADVGRT
jgi:bifunctional non-homologous end joining protein LigD